MITYKSGNTPLIKIKRLNKSLGLKNILIKDESKNPFGTFKDRRSELIIKKALNKKIKNLVIISSGNACYSLSRFSFNKIKTICLIDRNLKKSIRDTIKKYAYRIIEGDLSKNRLTKKEIKSLFNNRKFLDVSNGFHDAYISIINEIKKEKPDYLVVPIGSGEAFFGLYKGIKKYKLKTKLIGVGIKNRKKSFADKLHTIWTPYELKFKYILKDGHKIIRLNENEIKNLWSKFKNTMKSEPSSTVVFGVFNKIQFRNKDKIVLVNSGKGAI